MGRGVGDPGDRLGVPPAHVRERPPLSLESAVQLFELDAGLSPCEASWFDAAVQAVEWQRSSEPVGLDQKAPGEGHVRPRVAGAHSTYLGPDLLGLLHDLDELLEGGGPVLA